MLKYTKVKIRLFKDITMFDYVDSSVLGGVCIATQNISDNDDWKSTIPSADICSLYPILWLKNYRLVITNLFLNLIKISMDNQNRLVVYETLKFIQRKKFETIKLYLNFLH